MVNIILSRIPGLSRRCSCCGNGLWPWEFGRCRPCRRMGCWR